MSPAARSLALRKNHETLRFAADTRLTDAVVRRGCFTKDNNPATNFGCMEPREDRIRRQRFSLLHPPIPRIDRPLLPNVSAGQPKRNRPRFLRSREQSPTIRHRSLRTSVRDASGRHKPSFVPATCYREGSHQLPQAPRIRAPAQSSPPPARRESSGTSAESERLFPEVLVSSANGCP